MDKNERIATIQDGLSRMAEKWLRGEGLLVAGERVHIQITIFPPDSSFVKVSAKVSPKTRAAPKSRTDPCLSDDDWKRIFDYRWYSDDRVVLEMLKTRNNAPVTSAEVAARLGLRDWVLAIQDSRITNRLKKMGLGDLRLLSHGQEREKTCYCIYRMV